MRRPSVYCCFFVSLLGVAIRFGYPSEYFHGTAVTLLTSPCLGRDAMDGASICEMGFPSDILFIRRRLAQASLPTHRQPLTLCERHWESVIKILQYPPVCNFFLMRRHSTLLGILGIWIRTICGPPWWLVILRDLCGFAWL